MYNNENELFFLQYEAFLRSVAVAIVR